MAAAGINNTISDIPNEITGGGASARINNTIGANNPNKINSACTNDPVIADAMGLYLIKMMGERNYPVCLHLIGAGANLLKTYERGQHPAFYQIMLNAPDEVVMAMLKSGININHVHNDDTLLIAATMRRDPIPMIQYLIELGANINLATNYGQTALITALHIKNSEVALFLIRRGAHVAPGSILTIYDMKEPGKAELKEALLALGGHDSGRHMVFGAGAGGGGASARGGARKSKNGRKITSHRR